MAAEASTVTRRQPSLPPGTRLPRLAQSALWALSPGALSRYCKRRYGPTFTLRPLGIGDVVVVTQPEAIREVFTGDREVLRAGEANAVMGPIVGKHSLLTLDGERHIRHRRLVSAPFHGEAVRTYGERVAAIAAAEVDRWPVGQEFPIRPRMQAITLEVILRTVVGVSDERRLARLRTLLRKITQVGVAEMWIVWAYPHLIDHPVVKRLSTLRFLPEVDNLLYEEIAAHRAEPDGREDDVLSLLLAARDEQGEGLSDEELRDHLITLLVAGHETTTTALAWCFERLLRHPAAHLRLQHELDEGSEACYLDAVLNETLRVRPVIDAVWRKLSEPVEVAGWLLPAGATVMPSIEIVQHSRAFADAGAFRPERFLESSAGGRASHPYTFIPFGGGARRCVGASFAMMEMRAIVRTVLGRVSLRAPTTKSERVKVHHITLVPARGGRVIVTGRRGGAPRAEAVEARRPALAYGS
jgi:cytochrome P450